RHAVFSFSLPDALPISGPYSLEVTSPGVERPLRGPRDFAGRVGERVKVKTAEPVDGTRSFTGTLVAAGDRVVRIATEQGERTLSDRKSTRLNSSPQIIS